MHPVQVVATLFVFNVLAMTLVAKWYLAPRLASLPRERALVPLILVHLIRPITLWTLVPGVVASPDIPLAWSRSTAIGDALAALLALVAVLALRRGARWALGAVWVFNVVGLVDAIKNGVYGAQLEVVPHMGAGVLILSYAVPLLYVTHGLVFWLLLRRPRHPDESSSKVPPGPS